MSEQVEHHSQTEEPEREDCDDHSCPHGKKRDDPDEDPRHVERHEEALGKRPEAEALRKTDEELGFQLLQEMQALSSES